MEQSSNVNGYVVFSIRLWRRRDDKTQTLYRIIETDLHKYLPKNQFKDYRKYYQGVCNFLNETFGGKEYTVLEDRSTDYSDFSVIQIWEKGKGMKAVLHLLKVNKNIEMKLKYGAAKN